MSEHRTHKPPGHGKPIDVAEPAQEVALPTRREGRDPMQPIRDPMAYVRSERMDAAASVQRSLKAWAARSGAPSGAAKIPGPGSALPGEVRKRIEPHLGADLSGVTVNTSGKSAQAAEELGAKAFTVGQDVHFGAGQYAPGTKEGDRLLSHELAHTVQAQKSGIQRKATVEPHGDQHEHEADHVAAEVSQPHEPAEKEADAVGDHVAAKLHDGKAGGSQKEAGAEKAPAIGAKLDDGIVLRMPKWNGNDEEKGGRGEKGKSFRGGKKKDRDNWYGFDDPDFQNWWHRVGKQEFGNGKDLDNRQQAQAAYAYWVKQGKPRGGK